MRKYKKNNEVCQWDRRKKIGLEQGRDLNGIDNHLKRSHIQSSWLLIHATSTRCGIMAWKLIEGNHASWLSTSPGLRFIRHQYIYNAV